MTHIKVKKGLDIPIEGKPEGSIKTFIPSGEALPLNSPPQIALNVSGFDELKFKLLAKEGDQVKIGQPIAEDKDSPGRLFVSPAGGTIREIRRGLKRRLLDIVVEVNQQEQIEQHSPIQLSSISREELVEKLKQGGMFTHIRQRPFNFLADPAKIPRSIFVKALESAPFMPPAELQVVGHEKAFQAGLDTLAKLTSGDVNLVYRQDTQSRAFLEAKGVKKHTAEGPHPVANSSLHIQLIDRIKSAEDVVWTLNAHDVVVIGYFVLHGRYFVERVISVAGPGILDNQIGYFRVRAGIPIATLIEGKIRKGLLRYISGDVLTGHKVEVEDFLGFDDYCFCVIPEQLSRQFLHFFRLGKNRYTFTGAYLSGHLNNENRKYDFTTSQHGERRPFIEGGIYEDVMPLEVLPMHLVKAILAEDYDLAVELGLLEVDSEDFALPTFICPSKIEMMDIVKGGLRRYAADILK